MDSLNVVEGVGAIIDFAGVAIILAGIVLVSTSFIINLLHRISLIDASEEYRRGIGRTLLLGLELLVAADIIRTVAVSPTLENILVLALIVVVRTFLSWTLELELSGRWPWQRATEPSPSEEKV